MFPNDSGTQQKDGYLRSGRKFRSGKRRNTLKGRGSCSMNKGEYCDLASHVDGGSCNEYVDEIFIDSNMDLQWPHGFSLMPPSPTCSTLDPLQSGFVP